MTRQQQWLLGPPARQPPPPAHADLQALNIQAVELESRGITAGPAVAYIREHGPALKMDKWGGPLPLSAPEQDRLDRMMAILSFPMQRGRALIVSGTLDPGEADALRTVYPEVYDALASRARADMATTAPPYAVWAEQTLGVLFGKPAAKVYGEVAPKQQQPASRPKSGGDQSSTATPADRRELAVRQQER